MREDSPEPFHIEEDETDSGGTIESGLRQRTVPGAGGSATTLPRHVRRIGRAIVRSDPDSADAPTGGSEAGISIDDLRSTTIRIQEPTGRHSNLRPE
jgi:hypothetical protein